MTFSYVSGNPDNLVAGGSAQMIDIQGPLYDISAYLNSPVPISQPPIVTSLPSVPVEGQECVYKPAITRKDGANLINDGYWHMRYANGRWRYLGGAPYVAAIPGLFAIPGGGLGGGFLSLKTRISIPVVGSWKVGASVRASPATVNGDAVAGHTLGMFTLITGISDNAGSGAQYADCGASPAAVGAGGSVSGWNVWNVGSLSVPNFETWVASPQFLITGNIDYGTIWLEPVVL